MFHSTRWLVLEKAFDLVGEEFVNQRAAFSKHAPRNSFAPFHFVSKDDAVALNPQPAPAGQFSFELFDVALLRLQSPESETRCPARPGC